METLRNPPSINYGSNIETPELRDRRLLRAINGARSIALLAIMILMGGTSTSTELRKKQGKPSPQSINSNNEVRKSANRRNPAGPGNYYQDIIVYCRDSNDMIAYFCFWITN